MKSKGLIYILLAFLAVCACQRGKHREWIITPTGDTLFLNDSGEVKRALTYKELRERKTLKMLAYISPKTYYKYNGHPLGTQYLILMQYAQDKGFNIEVDSCKDSTEVEARLLRFEGDIAATSTPGVFKTANKELHDSIYAWYNDTIVDYVERMEQEWLSNGGIIRHQYPMYIDLDKKKISQYDNLFKKYAKHCKWDWMLLAAQCYQESTFDKDAFSWMGARGLMQIMPEIAEKIQLPFSEMFTPDMNIKAAVRLINELNEDFSYIKDDYERQNFILAAYNGGIAHVQDAMALAKADTVPDVYCWQYVSPYVLLLEKPKYYNRREIKHGYMRGSETYNYVKRIREIYELYSEDKKEKAKKEKAKKEAEKAKKNGKKENEDIKEEEFDPRKREPFRPPLIGLTKKEKEAVLKAWQEEMNKNNPEEEDKEGMQKVRWIKTKKK